MPKQLVLFPLPLQDPPVSALTEKQSTAIRSVLAEAMMALIKTDEEVEAQDETRKQD
jgi:hypothetical protein